MRLRRKSHHKRAAEALAARMLARGGNVEGYVALHGLRAGTLLYALDRKRLDALHRKGRD